MGFYETEMGAEYAGDDTDSKGNLIAEVEPGVLEQLPPGVKFSAFTPDHPVGNYAPFIKATLRGIASGLCVSYNSLAADLESVNYSSLRGGALEERDFWKMLQAWMIDQFCSNIYSDWLKWMLLTGEIPYPYSDFGKLHAPKWQPRSWAWVDPLKDLQANIEAIKNGLASRQEIAAADGKDLDDLLEQIKIEKELLAKYGLAFSTSAEPKAADNTGDTADGSNGNGKKQHGGIHHV
jgi:lambda family phage portal protein